MAIDDERPDGPTDAVVTTTRPAPQPGTDARPEVRRQPPYHVVILNDQEHSYDYVVEMLMKIFKHSEETAETLTWKVDHEGRAIVLTTHKELAELKREQVLSYGPDPRMEISKGPIGCVIEASA